MFYDGRPFPMNVTGEILDPVRAAELALVEAELHDDKMIAHLHYMVGVYSRGRDYTNFIMAGGYAAYIGVWTGVAHAFRRSTVSSLADSSRYPCLPSSHGNWSRWFT